MESVTFRQCSFGLILTLYLLRPGWVTFIFDLLSYLGPDKAGTDMLESIH